MCDDREKLIAYLYDESDPRERKEMDAHLATCDTCREELRGLGATRVDLLAWDVPAHESVWKPFASPQITPWWRQVPAWGMAAAATLVFGLGFAGGMAGRLFAAPAASPVMAENAPRTTVNEPNVVALESRLTALEHNGAGRLEPIPASVSHTPQKVNVDYDAIFARVKLLMDENDRDSQRTSQKIFAMIQEIETQRRRDVADLQGLINTIGSRSDTNILRAMNARGTAPEKEKEK
jgi:hypothetical protein